METSKILPSDNMLQSVIIAHIEEHQKIALPVEDQSRKLTSSRIYGALNKRYEIGLKDTVKQLYKLVKDGKLFSDSTRGTTYFTTFKFEYPEKPECNKKLIYDFIASRKNFRAPFIQISDYFEHPDKNGLLDMLNDLIVDSLIEHVSNPNTIEYQIKIRSEILNFANKLEILLHKSNNEVDYSEILKNIENGNSKT